MRAPSRWLRDDRGLVGKILLVWLVLLVVLVVGAIDAGSILLAPLSGNPCASEKKRGAAGPIAGNRAAAAISTK